MTRALTSRIRGFYAVIDRRDDALAAALLESASVVQVRIKGASGDQLAEVSRWARRATSAVGALLIVNDDVDVALAVGADGVHLGQDDLPVAEARRRAPELIIGVSTHNPAQVRRAVDEGADYLGYGPIYATGSKANPDPVQGISALAQACRLAAPVPVVAIGGIGPEHVTDVAAAGAAAVCAIAAVNSAPEPAPAARRMAAAFRVR